MLLVCRQNGFLSDIGGVMVSILALSVLDPWDRAQSGQTKDYKIGICCFSAIKVFRVTDNPVKKVR